MSSVSDEGQASETDDGGPPRLGSLERAFLEVLWSHDAPISARQVQAACADRKLAYATVRTVLERLVRKGLVDHGRDGRTLMYAAAGTREGFVAELMVQALQLTSDRDAALAHFARSVTASEAETLRGALGKARKGKR
jgi:predicted transcriptional regulator